MNKYCRLKTMISKKRSSAAKTVRIATTPSGGMPNKMACLPKTGAMPKNVADESAAKMPFVRMFIMMAITIALSKGIGSLLY
jgi:hypothetical protein